MKKNKLKAAVKEARKAAKETIALKIAADLKEITAQFGNDSKKLNKQINKGAKQLSKKILRNITIDKQCITASEINIPAGEVYADGAAHKN